MQADQRRAPNPRSSRAVRLRAVCLSHFWATFGAALRAPARPRRPAPEIAPPASGTRPGRPRRRAPGGSTRPESPACQAALPRAARLQRSGAKRPSAPAPVRCVFLSGASSLPWLPPLLCDPKRIRAQVARRAVACTTPAATLLAGLRFSATSLPGCYTSLSVGGLSLKGEGVRRHRSQIAAPEGPILCGATARSASAKFRSFGEGRTYRICGQIQPC